MATCEKCWREASVSAACNPDKMREDIYQEYVLTRKCTPEQQAGYGAAWCKKCGRNTVHVHANACMNTKCELLGIVL